MPRNIQLQTLRIGHEPKLSQRETADAAGLSLNRYWLIENGHAKPTDVEQCSIAAVFQAPVKQLFPSAPSQLDEAARTVPDSDRRAAERRVS